MEIEEQKYILRRIYTGVVELFFFSENQTYILLFSFSSFQNWKAEIAAERNCENEKAHEEEGKLTFDRK